MATLLLIAVPVSNATAQEDESSEHHYIVVLEDGASLGAATQRTARVTDAAADRVFTDAIKGFTVSLTPSEAAELAEQPGVALVERDSVITAADETIPIGLQRIDAADEAGIDGGGPNADVDIAVFDSGADTDHPDFNVVGGQRFVGVSNGNSVDCGDGSGSFEDDNGHGTHVTGIAAAIDQG